MFDLEQATLGASPDDGHEVRFAAGAHPAMTFRFIARAVGCLTPGRRPGFTDEMPFFAVTAG